MAEMYDVSYKCSNCGAGFQRSLQRGTKAPGTVECPVCGCATAYKAWPMSPGPRDPFVPVGHEWHDMAPDPHPTW